MKDGISTSALLARLFKHNSFEAYLTQNEQELHTATFCEQLKRLCEERGLLPANVILRSQIERTYGHQLFNGTRHPSRDKVLQLALGLRLSVEETQSLLRSADKSPLYPRLRRDSAVLYCLQKGFSVIETQYLLNRYGMTLLGGVREDDK